MTMQTCKMWGGTIFTELSK